MTAARSDGSLESDPSVGGLVEDEGWGERAGRFRARRGGLGGWSAAARSDFRAEDRGSFRPSQSGRPFRWRRVPWIYCHFRASIRCRTASITRRTERSFQPILAAISS